MSRSDPSGDGAWCDRLLAVPMPTVLYHATTAKKYARMVATGSILPPVRGFTTEAGARMWADEIHGTRPILLRLALTGPAYPLPDHHNEHGWAFWSPAPAYVERLVWFRDGDRVLPGRMYPQTRSLDEWVVQVDIDHRIRDSRDPSEIEAWRRMANSFDGPCLYDGTPIVRVADIAFASEYRGKD